MHHYHCYYSFQIDHFHQILYFHLFDLILFNFLSSSERIEVGFLVDEVLPSKKSAVKPLITPVL
eukprot:UN06773